MLGTLVFVGSCQRLKGYRRSPPKSEHLFGRQRVHDTLPDHGFRVSWVCLNFYHLSVSCARTTSLFRWLSVTRPGSLTRSLRFNRSVLNPMCTRETNDGKNMNWSLPVHSQQTSVVVAHVVVSELRPGSHSAPPTMSTICRVASLPVCKPKNVQIELCVLVMYQWTRMQVRLQGCQLEWVIADHHAVQQSYHLRWWSGTEDLSCVHVSTHSFCFIELQSTTQKISWLMTTPQWRPIACRSPACATVKKKRNFSDLPNRAPMVSWRCP